MVTEKNLTNSISEIGNVYLVVLVGKFISDNSSATDALIVSSASKSRNLQVIEKLKEQAKQEINYTIFNPEEYFLRRDIKDRFLRSIVNHPQKVVLIDKTKEINRTRTS